MKTAIGLLTLALALTAAPASAGDWSPTAPDGTPKDEAWCKAHGSLDSWCADLAAVKRLPGKPPEWRIIPPPEYDKPYTGYLEIIHGKDEQEVREQCPRAPFGTTFGAMACSMKLENKRDPGLKGCRVVIGPDEYLRKYGLPYDVVLRHELGHCNGWPGDHPGAQPFVDWAE